MRERERDVPGTCEHAQLVRVHVVGGVALEDSGDRRHVVRKGQRRQRPAPRQHWVNELHRVVLSVGGVRPGTEHQQRAAGEEAIRHGRGACCDGVRVAPEVRVAGPIRYCDALLEKCTAADHRCVAVGSYLHTHVRSPLDTWKAATSACPRLMPPSLAGTCWLVYTQRT